MNPVFQVLLLAVLLNTNAVCWRSLIIDNYHQKNSGTDLETHFCFEGQLPQASFFEHLTITKLSLQSITIPRTIIFLIQHCQQSASPYPEESLRSQPHHIYLKRVDGK